MGMISEGTDLPRLQVCCHLSRIKTELHFRQVLGRVLRVSKATNQDAFLYMPAEPTLVDYAERVAEHIPPDQKVVFFDKIEKSISVSEKKESLIETNTSKLFLEETNSMVEIGVASSEATNTLSRSYEASLNLFGRFYQEVINLSLSQSDITTMSRGYSAK